jgi:hypothetical protein
MALTLLGVTFAFAAGFSLFGESRDYASYELFFVELRPKNPTEYVRFEPGFVLATWIGKFVLFLQLPAYLFVLMSVALAVKASVFMKTTYPTLTMFFYLANWFPLHEYTQVRVAMATPLLFLSFNYLFQGKRTWAVTTSALAASFHVSALFAAAIVLISYSMSKYRMWVTVPALVGAMALLPFFITVVLFPVLQGINPLFAAYMKNSSEADIPTILSGSNILTILLLAFIAMGSGLKTVRHRTLFLVAIQALVVFIVCRDIPVLAHRLKEIGLVFLTLLAFDQPITAKRVPQVVTAVGLSAWSLYKSISLGII